MSVDQTYANKKWKCYLCVMVISQLKLNKSESWGGEFLMCRDAKMLNNSEVVIHS